MTTVFVFGVVFAFTHLYIRKLQRVEADIGLLRRDGANVVRAPYSQGLLPRVVCDFAGYPATVRQYHDLNNADEFIDVISRNPTITTLTVDGTSLSDSQVQRLLELPLTALSIDECPTGDTLVARASHTLERLSFHRTRLNDASLTALGDLPNVHFLDLTRTRVSDASIDYLAGLPSLKALTIRRCKISENGKRKLENLRPDVKIKWEPLLQ
ncbi:hypothetical protein SH528x_002431 [Novipirellula sp. SH528]|uniref:hypothetical protein n=1 Tax=Novipirellula sp. SH528 TaxID=3454466 RepID=UPI003F9EC81B